MTISIKMYVYIYTCIWLYNMNIHITIYRRIFVSSITYVTWRHRFPASLSFQAPGFCQAVNLGLPRLCLRWRPHLWPDGYQRGCHHCCHFARWRPNVLCSHEALFYRTKNASARLLGPWLIGESVMQSLSKGQDGLSSFCFKHPRSGR